MILCASELRSDLRFDLQADLSWDLGKGIPDVAALVALAGDAGFDGIAIGAHAALDDVVPLVTAAAGAQLRVPVVAAPLGEGRLTPGRRLPYLAAMGDDDERRAAVALFRRVVESVVPVGVGLVSVNLGAIGSQVGLPAIARRFARRELDPEEDDAGVSAWEAVLGERRSLTGPIHDAFRHALDRILPMAERHGVTVALEIAGGPWGIPSPREAADLVAEYREAPLGITWDDARMQVLRTLRIAPAPERLAALAAATRLRRAHEAVGLETGYLPGLGDPDGNASEHFQKAAPLATIVTGRPDSTREEVTRARSLVSQSQAAAASAAAG